MAMLNFSCIQIAIALLVFAQTKSSIEAYAIPKDAAKSCIANERSALRAFRAGLSDPSNLLSSWKGDDCCQWKGVRCSNRTGHVVELDLQGPDCDNSVSSMQVLGGNISSSLIDLQHLQYLDLSCNRFNMVQVPEFLGSFQELRYLDLSLSSFIGRIPPQFGNLSNLRYFNIDSTFGHTYSTDITWLSCLSSLEHLDMSFVNLSTITNWVSIVNKLHSLISLDLSFCELGTSPDSLLHSNLTSLETLDIGGNQFYKHVAPNWFWGLTSLKHLDASASGFEGPFPYEIGNMTSIVHLDLSMNNLAGMIPSNLDNLCNLEELHLFANNINGSITEFFKRLPNCSWNKLKTLFVPESNLTGSLPPNLEPLSNLAWLDLSDNKLTGPELLQASSSGLVTHVEVERVAGAWARVDPLEHSMCGDGPPASHLSAGIPAKGGARASIGLLSRCAGDHGFDAESRVLSNNLNGTIHEGHLASLANLDELSLAENSIAIAVNLTWVPPFNLKNVELRSCLLGPKFAMWLRWQTDIYNLDISNTSISDIVPDWFWTMASSVIYLNVRNNEISGFLSSRMEFMRASVMDLSSNQFSGPIPKLPINLVSLDLSRNNLYGPLPLDFGAPKLETLFLYNNFISGTIPSSLCNLRLLELLDLSNNELSGTIPECLDNESTTNTTSLSIQNLSLKNNNLSGEFPSFLQNCQKLIVLDLSHNQFFGTLQSWIGEKLPSLAFLQLRHNMFCGHIPMELTNLVDLQYLDLAYNNLSGSIPKSVVNYKGMAITGDTDNKYGDSWYYSGMTSFDLNEMNEFDDNFTVVTKGQERLYTGEIIYMVNLDLSCNNLTGEIPEEIVALVALKNLNLSWNAFSGKIPSKIGALVQLESLDLSHNELSGEIPTSLSALTSLSHLNMSYNNLSGIIPSGNQLQVLDDQASIYIGNPGLCGPPLAKKCPETALIPATLEDHQDGSDNVILFVTTSSGFVMGLWTVFCIFLFKAKWRTTWFSLYDRLYDCVYVQVAVGWASLTRKMGSS
ncbi:hypothetical protein ACP70R_037246 [Stipagrostis hirtigluma subsp. patula]